EGGAVRAHPLELLHAAVPAAEPRGENHELQCHAVALGRGTLILVGMSIEYKIDHARRLVTAKGRGILTGEAIMKYQREVWSKPEVMGFNELVDMSEVEEFDLPTVKGMKDLAMLSASMDTRGRSKFAIVAPTDEAFGLGRMYETYRRLEGGSKEVA